MYNITTEQIKDIAQGGGKSKIKQMFPQVFETKLEEGKWYKHSKLPIIFCLTSYEGSAYGYGLDEEGWFDHSKEDTGRCAANWAHIEHLIPATAKEVEDALIREAKKRGFVEGAKYKNWYASSGTIKESCYKYDPDNNTLGQVNNNFKGNHHFIFDGGKWAEILPEPKVITKTEAENRLQDLTGEKFKISDDVPIVFKFNDCRSHK